MTYSNSPCTTFDILINEVLDGTQPASVLSTEPHLLNCPQCQDTANAVALLLQVEWTQPTIPDGFVDRVIDRVSGNERLSHSTAFRRRTVATIFASLAASIAIFVLALPPTSRTTASRAKFESPPRIDDSLAQARSALVSLTKRTASETLLPAQRLFASVPPAPFTKFTPTNRVDVSPPPTTAFTPVTNTTKRAFDLFVRDLSGLAGIPKGNS